MSDIRAVTSGEHQHKRWVSPPTWAFAKNDSIAVIGLHELPKVMMQLPIGFARQDESYVPVVLMGLMRGQNLVISSQGQWLADHVPAIYRCYPFRMAKNNEGKFVLCVDHASGLVHEGPIGYRFFGEDNKPTAETNNILSTLVQLENDRILMEKACKILDHHQAIERWPLQIQAEDQGYRQVDGLYRISEVKMNQLPAEVVLELRSCGGLTLCYGQLFSMQHVHQLWSLAQRQHWTKKADSGGSQPNLEITEEQGILSFSKL